MLDEPICRELTRMVKNSHTGQKETAQFAILKRSKRANCLMGLMSNNLEVNGKDLSLTVRRLDIRTLCQAVTIARDMTDYGGRWGQEFRSVLRAICKK